MKLPIADIYWSERQVEVPDLCPHCGADLTLPCALVHFELQSQSRLAYHQHGELKWGTDLPEAQAQYIPLEWQCSQCRGHLASGTECPNFHP